MRPILLAAGMLAAVLAAPAAAQTVELKLAHFLPAGAPAQRELMEPWVKAVEEQSGGRIKVRIFPPCNWAAGRRN